MSDIDNINHIKLEEVIKKLNEFYASKNSIRSSNINNIQKSVVLLKKWNQNNTLNIVPDLENNGDLEEIINNLENPDYDLSIEYLNSLGNEFIEKVGLNILYQKDKKIIPRFLQFTKNISQKEVCNKLKNVLSVEEFNLGFEIYKLETTIPTELYNYFINDPGIDNLPFNIDNELILEKKLNYYRTIKSNYEFLENLSQIGINQNLKFDYTSEIMTNYNLNIEIQQQSLQIRDQINNAFNQINEKIELYNKSILDQNEFLNNI